MPVTTNLPWCPKCQRYRSPGDAMNRCRVCGADLEQHVRVHHSRCADPERLGCRCPASWPRRPEDVGLTHRRSGNCWAGNTRTDVCALHDEPRGECSVCKRCPACDAGAAA